MIDDERRRIAREAADEARKESDLAHRVKNLETEVGQLRSGLIWGMRAIWGGVAYLLMNLWQFLANGGSLK